MSTLPVAEVDPSQHAGPDRRIQRQWAEMPLSERLRRVCRLRQRIVERADALCAAVAEDLGKPAVETLACEILPWAEACRFLERRAATLLRPRRVSLRDTPLWLWGQRDTVYRRPRGIVGIIGTWNYPIYLNGVQIVQALTAGNAVWWKPSEVAPRTADALWDVFLEAGFPAGLLARLPATREAGRILTDGDVDHVVFTGHADTGRIIAGHLGRRLVSSTLELSGCDALFVLDDADLDLAAQAVGFGIRLNAGQTCLAVRRVFVARSVYEAFLRILEPLVVAQPPVRLALARQREQAEQLIAEAVAQGARILGHDSKAPPTPTDSDPLAMRMTVLADVAPDMAFCREATFAPVAAVLPFDRLEEALDAQNLCPYALGASVFTRRPDLARRIAARLRTGSVCVNDVIAPTAHPATPFGGSGASGWGVTQGAEGLLEMTFPQVVSQRGGSWRPHFAPPGSSRFTSRATLEAMLRWQHAATWRQRWSALLELLRSLS
ncbi:MAG: aldehyde dehydrogenase family protein [Gemmatales bacterium]|nr:aldehyde dehydrogenase family protein [Gemmatales bacterium]MDW8388396.1 aldehyde dehydrogenase family protein [Gemmatales bacterium]